MKYPHRHIVAGCTLALAGMVTSTASQAQISQAAATQLGLLSNVFINPGTAYFVGSNKALWNGLTGVFGPVVQPYSEGMRKLTISQPLRLKPTPLAPNPSAEVIPNSYTKIVSFGDSMSDTGNFFKTIEALGGRGMPSAPGNNGRWSDGVVVLEAMANALKLPLVNYAFAGARSGTDSLVPTYATQQGMLKQILDAVGNEPILDSKALYVLWTGPDDFYSSSNIFNKPTVNLVASNINVGLTWLYAHGARHFFVPQMPDLSITPSARDHNKLVNTYMANAKARSAELATLLDSTLRTFAKVYTLADVRTFATYTYSQTRMVQAAAEGINVSEPCYKPPFPGVPGPVCANPDKYLFWDTNHPTSAGSTVIGTDFAKAMVTAPLPSR